MTVPVEARVIDCMPDGYIPIGFVTSIKALNQDGEIVLIARVSLGITPWEAVGMAMSVSDDLRDALRNCETLSEEEE